MKTDKRQVAITIQGIYALLCNGFTDAAVEKLRRGSSAAISSRNNLEPREEAEQKLYKDSEQRPIIPGSNVFSMLVASGVFIKIGRKALTTMKSSLVPAILSIDELELPILRPDFAPVTWEVDRRTVVNPATGGRMVCHRPRFDVWQLSFHITYDASMANESIVRELIDTAGSKVGLGDFRPARKGPFGRFVVTEWKQLKDIES